MAVLLDNLMPFQFEPDCKADTNLKATFNQKNVRVRIMQMY